MSKLVLIKNFKALSNEGKKNEQNIYFDRCEQMESLQIFRTLIEEKDEKEYDVRISFANNGSTASFAKLEDAERLMDDLVAYLKSGESFAEFDLLNYETK